MNTFGNIFRLTTFGESHGPAMGGIIDGTPAGVTLDFDRIAGIVAMRRPGAGKYVSARNEADAVRFLSGIYEGKTLGTPIGFIVENKDCRPEDYDYLKDAYRPNHADYTYDVKYHIRDHRGSGRASARETLNWVVGGAVANEYLRKFGIQVCAYISQIGSVRVQQKYPLSFDAEAVAASQIRTPFKETEALMLRELEQAIAEGDSLGGVVSCIIKGIPPGLGEPYFHKFQSMLAAGMMSINAAKGFEYGDGFEAARCRGSQAADLWDTSNDSGNQVHTITNHSGGIQGGITNGNDVTFSVAFKPTATLMQPIAAMRADGTECVIEPHGRHDPCVAIRGTAVVEAIARMVTLDALLLARATRPLDCADRY